jgi:hypothetical protein
MFFLEGLLIVVAIVGVIVGIPLHVLTRDREVDR